MTDRRYGKARAFRLPQEYDPLLDELIDKSGHTQQDYLRIIVLEHLKEQVKPFTQTTVTIDS